MGAHSEKRDLKRNATKTITSYEKDMKRSNQLGSVYEGSLEAVFLPAKQQ